MKRLLLLATLLCCSSAVLAAGFDTTTGSFTDSGRNRKIPYRIYSPEPLQGLYPVIIFSHGLGGSRDGNEQFGKQLGSRGFVVINVQHEGSDSTLLSGARTVPAAQMLLQMSLSKPINAQNRFLDIPFAVKQLAVLNESDERLKGHLDLKAIGMAGHSYGAISTAVAAGERIGARYQSFKVPEVRAGVLLSPSAPREGLDVARVYADVAIPLFHMTGTNDVSLVDVRNVSAKDRVIPYRTLNAPNQYLLVLDQADHMTFSGRRIGENNEAPLDKKHMMAVVNGALLFFEAYLKDNKGAEKQLREEYKKTLDGADVFEFK